MAVLGLAVACAPPSACAATLTWGATGGGGTGNWDLTTGGWWNGTTGTWNNTTNASDTAWFGGTAGTVTLSTGITAGGLTFDANGYTVTGNTLTFANTTGTAAVTVNPTYAATISSVIAGSNVFNKLGSGTLTLSGNNTYSGNTVIDAGVVRIGTNTAFGTLSSTVSKVTVKAGGAVDFNGVIDATYGYTISGSGVGGTGALVNNGAEIGTGKAQASNIKLAADAAIGGSGNWALLTSGFNPTSLDLGGFTLTKTGANTIWLCNTTATSGTIRIAAGTLSQANRDNSVANVAFTLDNVGGATLSLGDRSMTIGSLAGGGATGGNVVLGSGTLTVGGLNTSTTFSGTFAGTGVLTKIGSGTLTLTGNSNGGNTGGIVVNAGTLVLNAANATWNVGMLGGPVTVNNGAVVQVVGGSNSKASQVVNVNGGGSFQFTNAFSNVGDGASYWGTFNLNSTNGFAATVSGGAGPRMGYQGNGTISSTGSVTNTYSAGLLLVNGGGYTMTFAIGSGTLAMSGTISDFNSLPNTPVYKTGTGTLLLSGPNTFSGNITVNAGTIKIGNTTGLGAANTAVTKVVVNSGGAVDLGGIIDATYGYTISGSGADGTGALVNTGAAIGTGIKQTTNLKLGADAAIGGTGNWAILAASYVATTLDLNGFTLTKTGANTITLVNTTI